MRASCARRPASRAGAGGADLRHRRGEPRQQPRSWRRRSPAQGYDVELHEVPDMHNYTGWRDALDPHLTGLLAQVWG